MLDQKAVNDAIKFTISTDGWKVIEDWIKSKIELYINELINGKSDDLELVRGKIQGLQEISDTIKSHSKES